MELTHTLDLEKAINITNLKPWTAPGGFFCWSLAPGASIGYLTSPECRARLGYGFQGFQVVPSEGWVSVAVIRPPNQFMKFFLGEWIPVEEPVFVSCEAIRETLPLWSGSIKFRLKLEQIPENYSLSVSVGTPQEIATRQLTVDIPAALSGSPFVSQIKLGYSVALGDMVDYALSFALPERLGQPVKLTRTVIVGDDGVSVALPPGIAKDKIESASFLAPGSFFVGASVQESKILLNRTVTPGSRGVLMFSFKPEVEAAGDIFQVSSTPSIALMSIEEKNRQYTVLPEWIKAANQKEFKWIAAYSFDQVVEVVAIAQEGKDVRAICDKLLSIIDNPETAFLELHPWGKKIPISIAGGVDSGTKLRVLPGLNVQSFRIVLGGLVRGAIGDIKGS
jgi:hypothetical protein